MIEYLNFIKLLGYSETIYFSPYTPQAPFNVIEKSSHIPFQASEPSIKKTITPMAKPKINIPAADLSDVRTLEDLKSAVMNFNDCDLKKFAKNTVFADGNPTAKIMLIGEAPGEEEDINGIPFCGKSGKLLDAMLASIDVSRIKNCYITNNIFWRPPGNRAPTDEELVMCRPFLEKHIEMINPDILICVGGVAAKNILQIDESVSVLRSKKHEYTNKFLTKHINTFVIYHPAYLLRSPSKKRDAYLDLLNIAKFITQQGAPSGAPGGT